MYNVNATKKLGDVEINAGLEGHRSWHHQFKHSAYVYVGGLHQGLTEGDVIIMFSQFGDIIDINVIRDKSTGKSKGFAFVCYEDQRSTILAVDNMNGFVLLGRTLRVDHVDKYKAPKKLDENEKDEDGDPKLLEYKATGAEGGGHQVYNILGTQKRIAEVQVERASRPGQAQPEDADEAWAQAFEENLKATAALKKVKKKKKKGSFKAEMEELKRMKKETKKLKREVKKAKETGKAEEKKGKKAKKKEDSSSSSSSSDGSSGESSASSEKADAKKRKEARKR